MSNPSRTSPAPRLAIPYQSGDRVRQSFIDFFRGKGHQYVPSAPVVPHDDPTLLFTNAGMNQFKANLLGDNKEGYKRVANSQKCIRVSGKHNDLDEVGRDTYHHTFFEMLGNWSFGDYYKREAIAWAWELLTEVWGLPKDRLFATVYKDDDEAIALWKDLTDLAPDRILRFDKENFWEMGEVGPCGPCSEIHFDLGDEATREATFAHPVEGVNGKTGRYIEIWNLVFMQSERLADGSLKRLKNQNVDTGMGFERIASIIQGVFSNYETDVFRPVLDAIASLSGVAYEKGEAGTPHRVIADHLRALSFAIADGATPGNEGRGYVLRRILRRASRFARNLGQREPFVHRLVPVLAQSMGAAYPELAQRQGYVAQVIQAEEERFMRTLDQGLERFAKVAAEAKAKGAAAIPGAEVFTLHDTYGFPADLTGVLAEERGLGIDLAGYEAAMREQRERARGAAKFDGSFASEEGWTVLRPGVETRFVGYERLEAPAEVLRYREVGDTIYVVLAETPFYAESGGQVGDSGTLSGSELELRVEDTVKVFDMIVHKCALIRGLLKPEHVRGLVAIVDGERREATLRNHSATHLLHAALREVLGPHVQQQGSRVAPESLRFDFTHHQAMAPAEIAKVEAIVNRQIQADLPISHSQHALEEAKTMGAMALFGEKYGDRVRVIRMGEFSMELCGGTHAAATGQIGLFKILSESSTAAGVRRIEAVTGPGALDLVDRQFRSLAEIGKVIKAKPGQELDKVAELSARLKAAEKEVQELRSAQAAAQAEALWNGQSRKAPGGAYLVAKVDGGRYDKDGFNALADGLAARLQDGLAILTHAAGDGLTILALVGKGIQAKAKAGDIVKELAPLAEGKGGGRPDRAQAGSRRPDKEGAVLAEAEKLAHRLLGG